MDKNQLFKTIFRIILGVFLIAYALNQFFYPLPQSYPTMPSDTKNFIDAAFIYLPLLYVFEIILGFLLIAITWTPFLLNVLFQLSGAFVIFISSNQDLSGVWQGLFIILLSFILLFFDKEKYRPLFNK